jgi:Domain of unknown function (DUF4265)
MMADTQVLLLPDPEAPERVQVSPLLDGYWLVTDIPCYSETVGFLDVVSARYHPELGLVFDDVLHASMWSTYGVLLKLVEEDLAQSLLAELEANGCLFTIHKTADGGYVSVAAPPDQIATTRRILEEGHSAGAWMAGIILERGLAAVAA